MRWVWDYLSKRLEREKLHMILLDPEKTGTGRAGEIAKMAHEAGSCAIMVGGSTGGGGALDKMLVEIKSETTLPVILFPSGASLLSRYADAVYFMSLLNSRSIRYLIGEQLRGVPFIKRYGIEPIPMGYIVVEPGGRVGEVGNADLIPRDDVQKAVEYALLAQYMGMKLVYLEAGSGAPEPVPAEMIKTVKESVSIPLIVGGGIRSPESARKAVKAGADIIVTGTLIEGGEEVESRLREMVEAIKAEAVVERGEGDAPEKRVQPA